MTRIEDAHPYRRTLIECDIPDSNAPRSAPIFDVPERKVVAVDHPCIVINLEKGLRSFGPKPNFSKVSCI